MDLGSSGPITIDIPLCWVMEELGAAALSKCLIVHYRKLQKVPPAKVNHETVMEDIFGSAVTCSCLIAPAGRKAVLKGKFKPSQGHSPSAAALSCHFHPLLANKSGFQV